MADFYDETSSETPLTSLTLIQRLSRGDDENAWNDFLHLYYPLIYGWCRRGGLQAQDAADVVQEVFRAVVCGVSNFRRDRQGDSFHAWLRGITQHKLQDFWRTRGQGRQRLPAGGTSAWQRLERVPQQNALEDSLEEDMSRVAQRALQLVRMEFEDSTWDAACMVLVAGRTPADVAEQLGMTPNAVYKAKARVMRRVREKLGDLVD